MAGQLVICFIKASKIMNFIYMYKKGAQRIIIITILRNRVCNIHVHLPKAFK